MTIDNGLYERYFNALLAGDKRRCLLIVQDLLQKNVDIRDLHSLFQKSMYEIGDLWETNRISVAREHLATSITERMLSATYPLVFTGREAGKKVVVSCAQNEFHVLGAMMVADVFELHGWDSHFLGANTPIAELLRLTEEIRPDLLALSFSLSRNLSQLKPTVEAIRAAFGSLDIFVGGHAFIWAGTDILSGVPGIQFIETLARLEENL